MKITDDMLYQHAAEARDIWLESLPDDSELPEHDFSPEFEAQVKKMAAQAGKRKKKSFFSIQRAAAMFLVGFLGIASWLTVDADARATLMQWMRSAWEGGILYTFTGEAPDTDIPDFHCAWLPEGMEAAEYLNSDNSGYIIYFGGEDLHCSLDYSYMHQGSAQYIVPSGEEGLRHETVEVNGLPGDFYLESEEGLAHMLVWFDAEADIAFSLHSNLPPEDILQMAESVEEGAVLELMPEYECTWLPEGYDDGSEMYRGSHQRQLSFLNEDGDLRLKYELFEAATLEEQFWIESAENPVLLSVHGQEARLYYNTNRDEHSLLWLDEDSGIAFRLDAAENEETMAKIAESVKRK